MCRMFRRPVTHLLVVRFSALGDVAMSVPVVDTLARRHPHLRITVLSRPACAPLFDRLPANVAFRGVDLRVAYAGRKGLDRLFAELMAAGIDGVADFHGVLRSHYLRLRFALRGVPTARIRKGRWAKRRLVNHAPGAFVQLPSSVERYGRVLARLGFRVDPDFRSLFPDGASVPLPAACGIAEKVSGEKWIGIAPFAAHRGKVYPPERMEEVIARLSGQWPGARFFVFTGRGEAAAWRQRWEGRFDRLLFTAGRLGGLSGELALMSRLDVMVSMDSANMHLASLAGVPVVSIWGATHPYAGFLGYGQSLSLAVQVDLLCRPCSVYGGRACRRGDYACLHLVTPDAVVSRTNEVLFPFRASHPQFLCSPLC